MMIDVYSGSCFVRRLLSRLRLLPFLFGRAHLSNKLF
uniref:Uncharacterized protein n=1 Tax=Parascaris equorum TaxID=6256 RepID=A0A914S3H4_PAREQ